MFILLKTLVNFIDLKGKDSREKLITLSIWEKYMNNIVVKKHGKAPMVLFSLNPFFIYQKEEWNITRSRSPNAGKTTILEFI